MADFKLTENQAIAVNDKSGTLLVAAAAGSGKTAILARRLIDRLCDSELSGDISEYLVVTFTKAATAELKARLYKELCKYVKEHPANARARRQLSLIGLARISTIHSFCLDIIRANFEALSLPSTLRMGEETENNVLLTNTLDSLISEMYESADDGSVFLKAVEILSGSRNDESLTESILSLYKKLRSLSEPRKKFASFIENYREVECCEEIFDTSFGKLIAEDLKYETGRTLCDLDCLLREIEADEAIAAGLYGAVSADYSAIDNIRSALSSGYDHAKAAADSLFFSRAKPIKDYPDTAYLDGIKDHRQKCNNKIKGVFKRYLGADSDTVKRAACESREVLEVILRLLDELDSRFSEKKLERGLLDYSDLEQFALKLLVENTGEFEGEFKRTELAKDISRNFREIYVDEYQDTNSIQDMIFRAVSSYDDERGTENNRFLVGDVKQSIYRFRGAQPEIFSSYIRLFTDVKNEEASLVSTHKIYLSNNFRCSENVIDSTNLVFEKIMPDYDENERLIYSKSEKNKVSAPCELVLVSSKDSDRSSDKEKLSDEALYIASRIRDMVQNPRFLNEDGEMYRYSDFAILSRSANSLSEQYRRAFKYAGIPLSQDTPEDFFSLPEILLVMCLLNCIDNPQRDIYTAGLMYSPLFGFSADELCEIRSYGKKLSFFSCTELFVSECGNSQLGIKANAFLKKIAYYRNLSRGTPTNILISALFEELNVYDLYSAKSPEKKRNIRKIYELSRSFEKTSFRGLSAFLDYLSDIASGNVDSRPEAHKDSVKFMSIHRSKGLEFPVVFLSGATREFNVSDEKEPFIFNAKHGIGIKLRDTSDTLLTNTKRNFSAINTPFREAIKACERSEMLEEEKRLLYVAMTRARDRLVITAHTKDIDRTFRNAQSRKSGGFETYGKYSMCYFDLIYHTLDDLSFQSLFREESDCECHPLKCFRKDVSADYFESVLNKRRIEKEETPLDTDRISVYSEMISSASKNTPYHSSLSKIPAKISVSQLKKGLLDEEPDLSVKTTLKKLPAFMQNNNAADAAEIGTATHIFMQFADFGRIERDGSAAEADRLLEKGFINERMRKIIDLSVIDTFIGGELYKQIKKAPKLYRERRFNLKLPASDFTENGGELSNDDFILVQGVSDLYYEIEDGSIVLVDFKTDHVKKDGGEETLKSRHSEQLRYYKRAISEITGKTVSAVYLYSFSLGKEVLLEI